MKDSNPVVEVKNVTQRFGRKTALDDLSFTVGKGEILGFLGPNGAGKTTTMRVLTGYLSPTGGSVRINGIPMQDHALELRRQIGYMPEQVPLYGEMRVHRYLRYRAGLKGLRGKSLMLRVGEVMEQCGLQDVRRAVIGTLSRGYCQRLGLADALVHHPPLLLLDEPSAGLDPNQIREVRELIRGLADAHTVILSSHLLSEVDMVATRILILHQGKLVAADSKSRLKQFGSSAMSVRAEVRGSSLELMRHIQDLPSVGRVDLKSLEEGWVRIQILAESGEDPREALFSLCRDQAWPLRELHRTSGSLEDIFVQMTRGDSLS